jgi:transcriptional regulator with XRE-family HTH domain
MRINGQLIQARRRQLGLSLRQLAKDSATPHTVLNNLERKNEADKITGYSLGRLLGILNLSLGDIDVQGTTQKAHNRQESGASQHKTEAQGDLANDKATADLVRSIGAYLVEFGKGVHATVLCRQFSVTIDQLNAALRFLGTQLPAMGMMLHHASTGICLRAAHDAQIIDPSKQKERYLVNLQDPDLRILSRLLIQGELNYKQSTATPDGTIRVQRLIGAGLVEISGSRITLSPPMTIGTVKGVALDCAKNS